MREGGAPKVPPLRSRPRTVLRRGVSPCRPRTTYCGHFSFPVKSRFRLGFDSDQRYHLAMAGEKADTVRKTITLTRISVKYLETLAKKGTHGSDWSGIATNFVEKGLREAIKDGFMEMGEGQKKD